MEGCPLSKTWKQLYIRDPILLVYLHDPTVVTLDLSHCGLTEVPPSIGCLVSLVSLDLSNNEITSLPVGMANLTALEVLIVDNNPLAPHLHSILEKV